MLPDAASPGPASLMMLLAWFGSLFTAPSFRTFCGLACGFLAQAGRRTLCGYGNHWVIAAIVVKLPMVKRPVALPVQPSWSSRARRRSDRHPFLDRGVQPGDQAVTVDQCLLGHANRTTPRGRRVDHRAISSRRLVSVTRVDHQNPVTTTHLPGGEAEHAPERSGPFMTGRTNAMTSVFGAASTEVAA